MFFFNQNVKKFMIPPFAWGVALILCLQSSFPSKVVCFGADGHVSLEYAINGKCTTPTKENIITSISSSSVSETPSEHCGGCYDVFIPEFDSTKQDYVYQNLLNSSDLLPILTHSVVELISTPNYLLENKNQFRILFQPIQISLQTIVLII